MSTKIIVSYDGTNNEDDAIALGRIFARAGGEVSVAYVRHAQEAGSEREEALKLAKTIATKSSLTVKIGKEAFYRQIEMPLAEAYKYAAEVMVENMLARDAEEGISAFIEKREPKWQDR